jgi:hypothetical protein
MIYRILALILLLATSAHANKWVRTNDVNGLTLNPATLTGTVGQVRITTFALDGSTPKDLTGLAAWLAVVDVEDSYSTITPAQIITPTNGHVIGLTSLEAGTYTARLMAGYSTNDSLAFPIAWETIVITNPPSAGGASVSVSVTTTANVTVVSSGTGNVVTGITANGSVVTEHRGTVEGGGDSYPIAGVYPVGVTNYLGTSYVYLVSSGGIVIQPSIGGTNVIQFGGPTSYFYSVPVDKNLLIVDSWTAAGGGYQGGAGSHAEIYIPVTGGELLEFICGQAGSAVPATNASGLSTAAGGWPNGGLGINRNNYSGAGINSGSGAGYSAIKRGTNWIYVGGGGSGGGYGVSGGTGGGISGGSGLALGIGSGAGLGGTQTDGGAAATSSVPLAITNTAGYAFAGGNAGATTNLITGSAGGGGAGWFGGSGGLSGNSVASRGSGGGGSSWANTNLSIYFSTTRGIGQTPPKQELPWYGSDSRGIGWGVNVSTNGGNSGMVIREATM